MRGLRFTLRLLRRLIVAAELITPLACFIVLLVMTGLEQVRAEAFDHMLLLAAAFVAGGVCYALLQPRLARWWNQMGSK